MSVETNVHDEIQGTISLSNKGGHSYSIYVELPDENGSH
jgi:hypothetical protein